MYVSFIEKALILLVTAVLLFRQDDLFSGMVLQFFWWKCQKIADWSIKCKKGLFFAV